MKAETDFEELAPWLALVITGIGFCLRILLLGSKSMWLDETFSVWAANQSVPEMLRWVATVDQHPPLYYLLLHYWIALNGDTPYYARLLSVLFGTATIPVVYLIGRRISGVVVGLTAATLMALSPFNIYFAQETRMYAVLTFNAAVAIYALAILLTNGRSGRPIGSEFREYVRARRTAGPVEPDAKREFSYADEAGNQRGWRGWVSRRRLPPTGNVETDLAWVALVVFSAATLLTHNTAVFFVLATNVFVLGLMFYQRIRKAGASSALRAPSLVNWVVAQIGIVVLWSVWLLAFIRQASRVDQEFWLPKPTWDDILRALRYLLNASFPDQPYQVMTWVLCAFLCLGLVYYRKKLSIFFFLAALFAIPLAGELLVSMRRPIFMDKTLIWITIPLFLLLGAGIAQLKFRVLMVVAVLALATNYMLATTDYYRVVPKEDWGTAAGYVANFAQQNDLVLFNDAFVQIPFDYCFKQYEDLYGIEVQRQGIPAKMGDGGVLEPKMTDEDIPGLAALLNGQKRVWLVYSHNWYTDPEGLVPQTIAASMKLSRQRDFYGGRVQLYESP